MSCSTFMCDPWTQKFWGESEIQTSGLAFSGFHSFTAAAIFPWVFAMVFAMFL